MYPEKKSASAPPSGEPLPEIPEVSSDMDNSLPDPMNRKETPPSLSELDALERAMQLKALTAQEKEKLNRLSKQEKVGITADDGAPPSAIDTPEQETEETTKKGKSKKKKASKKTSDEEELNQLMMQN
jgi:hypothetical protein